MAGIMTNTTETKMSTPEEVRALFNLTDSDLEALRRFGALVTPKMDAFVDRFYVWLKTLPEFEVYFPEQELVDHVKSLQRLLDRGILSRY